MPFFSVGFSVSIQLLSMFSAHRPIIRWRCVVRSALENCKLTRLFGDKWDRLNARGTSADYRNAHACEVDTFMGPAVRKISLTSETLYAFHIWFFG